MRRDVHDVLFRAWWDVSQQITRIPQDMMYCLRGALVLQGRERTRAFTLTQRKKPVVTDSSQKKRFR